MPELQTDKVVTTESKPLLDIAYASSCKLPEGAVMRVVEYFDGPPTKDDTKCDGSKCSLKGWLYLPKDATTGHKAVVFLHGHARDRNEPCGIVEHFLEKGWVVFAPVRRGNTGHRVAVGPDGKKHTELAFANTGVYIDDWARAQALAQLGSDEGSKYDDVFEAYRVEYLRSYQVHDVAHALEFLAEYRHGGGKLIDSRRIGVIGHSYGGALAVLSSAGAFKVNPAAIADIAGAELSWDAEAKNNPWKEALVPAVWKRKVPIFFLQPRNGKHIEPTITLSHEAATSGDREFQAALFPPVEPNSGAHDVHDKFIGDYLDVWGLSVRDFFDRYFPE
jgi:dienelactone hydrolase